MEDDDSIPISALQHFVYCPRQCALIHLERVWAENRETSEGRLLHARTDQPAAEHRRGVRTVTAMPLLHRGLRLVGVADAVEFHREDGGERVVPIEYKRGRPKSHYADEIQLCAQALCLEEMLGRPIPAGALYYGKTRRRKEVVFDCALRNLTENAVRDVHAMLASGRTPLAVYEAKRCDACSLIDLCQPRLLAQGEGVDTWLCTQLEG
jgi:CRISPR-associated exonuclease Cas4